MGVSLILIFIKMTKMFLLLLKAVKVSTAKWNSCINKIDFQNKLPNKTYNSGLTRLPDPGIK